MPFWDFLAKLFGAPKPAERPAPVPVGPPAAAAVEADRAARAAVKAQKKAAAAERKRLRAEAVAHRKATDIVFLGRGVSTLLNDRAGDAEKLTAAGLPVLHTPADLAAEL